MEAGHFCSGALQHDSAGVGPVFPTGNDAVSAYYTVRNPNDTPRRPVAYSELFANLTPPIPPNVTWLRSTTDGTYRYVRRRLSGVNIEELFDLTADPCNLFNLNSPTNQMTPQQQAAFNALSAAMNAIAPS